MTTQHVVMMGVSGSGKTTVGKRLAEMIGAAFLDADSLHPAQNVEKMKAGIPLDDADRKPWLEEVGRRLAMAGTESLVVACSALKKVYRDVIRAADPGVRFVLLLGPGELLTERLKKRKDHFAPPSLLDSQLQTLELLEPDELGFRLNIAGAPEELAREAVAKLAAG